MLSVKGSVSSTENLLFNAVLRPNRNLSKKGFKVLMGFIFSIIFICSLGFFLAGAWPVLGFLGLDVALVYFAFRFSYRSGGQYELVQMTEDEMLVTTVNPWGQKRSFSFQPYWLQISLKEQDDENSLILSSHGRSISLGRFLAPIERKELADKLVSVLNRLKQNQV
ncbi:hypothetical protein WH95_14950 [Kiloniella litopenaei]|uniref:DUF2244 domain-containing protein n=1 Tax=Kiloniella litopenaei TaxID=1549748 RepID=A0A0M2R2D7_9PROT|nr:DUF2244 domain-containing protein [Kiloniella litopenaei]KKJ76057.1 hypothetical protein WH95_14950 [Kiloniella litopenaei]